MSSIHIVREEPEGAEEMPSYINSMVTDESALDVYTRLDSLYDSGSALTIYVDEDELNDILTQIRRRKVKCGSYLLKRDIYLVYSDDFDQVRENWWKMIDDGVLKLDK